MIIKRIIQRLKSMAPLPPGSKVIRLVQEKKLTYLSQAKLAKLASICAFNENNNIPGDIIETGCALGGSGIVMAASKAVSRSQKIYDVFGEIPAPSEKDGEDVQSRYDTIHAGKSEGIDGETYYGYVENLYEVVKNSFNEAGYPVESNNVSLFKGLLQDTLIIDQPVALAHIDVDWYDPVYVSLERICPHLSLGGTFVVDDYLDWSGCREAVDEFFKDKKERFEFDTSCGSLVITRIK